MSIYTTAMSSYAKSQLAELMPTISQDITEASADPQIVDGKIAVALSATVSGPISNVSIGRTYDDLTEFLTDLLGEEPVKNSPSKPVIKDVAEVVEVEPDEAEDAQDEDEAVAQESVEVQAKVAMKESVEAQADAASAALARARAAAEEDKPAPRRRTRKPTEKDDAPSVPAGDDEF